MRFVTLANHFGRRYRHMIVAMDGNYACENLLDPDLGVGFEHIDTTKGAMFGNVRSFRRMLRAIRPDLLVTYNWGSIEWAIANIPSVVRHIHIEDGFGPEERATQLRRRVLTRRLVLRRATVVLPSRTLLRIATEQWRLAPARVHYVPNGIDLGRFAAKRSMATDGEPVIGTVAALRPEKRLDRLLRAFHLVLLTVPARLVIVGDGPERPALERLALDLGIAGQVRFAGHVDAPAACYGGFDVFALSSDTEQMPLSVIEAMAASLPVAATDVGDVRTMLSEANLGFVTTLDDAALAEALLALARHPAMRDRLGEANRAKAAVEFDRASMLRSYAALFDGTAVVGTNWPKG